MSGDRLKLARKKAGLSLRDLAEELSSLVSAQAIGKYERGEMMPSSEVLLALSKALKVSIQYLIASDPVELGCVEFRTKANTTARDRARVETEVIEWVERYLQIERILDLDSATWVSPFGELRTVSTFEEAEQLANELRHKWRLGIDPIPNITDLLEEMGIKVCLAELPPSVSGLTCFVKKAKGEIGTPVIVVNKSHSVERRRFTMAHELGHRLLKASNEADVEKLCQRFAGAFLMHREHLLKEVGERRSAFGVRELLVLKRLYRVSAVALLMRLGQVGELAESSMEYAFRTFARTWRTTEPDPLEDPKEKRKSEEPRRFERLVYRGTAEDLISLSKAVELLRIPLAQVEEGLRGPLGAHADHR
jgi:Zn-dependent peptidase ImmA (M78 family)/DNA-binding XRE family transcriptional regulator